MTGISRIPEIRNLRPKGAAVRSEETAFGDSAVPKLEET